MTVNEKIKAHIESRGMNLTHVAKKIGMSKQNLSSVLNNKDMKLSQLRKICHVLGVPVTYFFEDRMDVSRFEPDNRIGEALPPYSKDEQISILMRDINQKIEQLDECREEVKRLRNPDARSNGQ